MPHNPTQYPTNPNSLNYNLRLLSINKARKELGIRYETMRKLIDEGKIEVIRIGKRYKIPALSISKYIEENAKKISQEENVMHLNNSRDFINNKIDSIINNKIRSH